MSLIRLYYNQIKLFQAYQATEDFRILECRKDTNVVESDIKIYHHPNPQIKSFLTDTEISVPRVEAFRQPLDSSNEDVLKQIGSIAGQIVRDIMSIPGVLEIRIKPKEIRMKKKNQLTGKKLRDRSSRSSKGR